MQPRNNSPSFDPIANPNSFDPLKLFWPECRLMDFSYAHTSSSPEFTGITNDHDQYVLFSHTFRKPSDPCLNHTVRQPSDVSLLQAHPCPNSWTVAPHSRLSRSNDRPPDGFVFRNCSCLAKDLKIVNKCLSISRTRGLVGCCISCSGLLRNFSKQAASNLWSGVRTSVRPSVSSKRMNQSSTIRNLKLNAQLSRFHQETEKAYIGSRLNLNRLVPDGDSSATGLFSASSLESLLFELLERRSDTDFVSCRELEPKRSSASHIMLPNTHFDKSFEAHSNEPLRPHRLEPKPTFFDASHADLDYTSVRAQCCLEHHDQHLKRLWG